MRFRFVSFISLSLGAKLEFKQIRIGRLNAACVKNNEHLLQDLASDYSSFPKGIIEPCALSDSFPGPM